jgi:hypothetical protein
MSHVARVTALMHSTVGAALMLSGGSARSGRRIIPLHVAGEWFGVSKIIDFK